MQSAPAFGAPPSASAMPGGQGNNSLQNYQTGLMVLQQTNPGRFKMLSSHPTGLQQQQQQQQVQQQSSPTFAPAAAMLPAAMPGTQTPSQQSDGAVRKRPFTHHLPSSPVPPPPPAPASLLDSTPFGTFTTNNTDSIDDDTAMPDTPPFESFDFDSFLHTEDDGAGAGFGGFSAPAPPAAPPQSASAPKTPEQLLHHLIALQTFQGSWDLDVSLISALKSGASINLDEALVSREISSGVDKTHLATAIIIVVLETKLAAFRGSWELVIEKARAWLEGEMGGEEEVEKVVERGRKVVL